jgi:A/G-specific adenine glycosylase
LHAASIRRALLRWYERAQRDLPWRRATDPYAIWISEIMLQQTRVAAVIPYYQRFLASFPNAKALARAPEAKVLTAWSGLGYYSRARNLQKAARQIAGSGCFPKDYDSIRELAGIGDYTASAIASIALGLPHAAVDGNVRRVIVRLVNDNGADVQTEADRLLDRCDPGRWNQAMMELGATVCLPRDPHCGECPLARQCGARQHGTQNDLPAKRAKPTPERLTRTLLVIFRRARILLVPSPRVKGFWELPEPFEDVEMGKVLREFRHTITHRHYRFVVREATTGNVPEGSRWCDMERLEEIPLSTIARKALAGKALASKAISARFS